MTQAEFYLSERETRRRRGRRFFRATLFFLLLFSIAWGAALAVIRGPWLYVRDVEITGNERVSRDAVNTLLYASISRDNFLKRILGFRNMLVWPPALTSEDLRFLPQLKSVALQKRFRERKVVVRVQERRPLAIWCNVRAEPAGCVWFDDEGVAVEPAPLAEGNLLWTVNDYSGRTLRMMEKVLPGEFTANLLSMLRVLEAVGVSVREVRIEDIGLQEARAILYDGPDVYFSLRFPSDTAAGVLQSLISSGNFRALKYVDFRVENRAYYQ